MKLPSLLLAFLSAATLPLHAEVSPIRIAVEQISKTESKDKTGHDKTQVRSLKITLNNNSGEAFDGLVVKYWFLGHALTEHNQKVLSEGERKSSLTPRGKDVVESETISKHYVEAHTAPAKGGKGGAAAKVPASGEKITGYAVRVMKEGKVLADYYSEPSYKDLVEKPGAAAPAPAAKPAKK
jgi:hypothetical protein